MIFLLTSSIKSVKGVTLFEGDLPWLKWITTRARPEPPLDSPYSPLKHYDRRGCLPGGLSCRYRSGRGSVDRYTG